jgi:hypothetical protein
LPPKYKGPHETLSEAITITLDTNAQSLVQQTIEADRREIEKALAEAKAWHICSLIFPHFTKKARETTE